MSSRASRRLGQRVGEAEDGRGAPAGVVGGGVDVEVEGAGFGVGRLDLHGEVAQRQVLEAVLPLRGVEQVRHDGRVVAQRADVGAEPVHQLLRPVDDERRTAAARRSALPAAATAGSPSDRAVEVGDPAGVVTTTAMPSSGLLTGTPSQRGSTRVAGARGAYRVEPLRDGLRVAQHLDVGFDGLGLGRRSRRPPRRRLRSAAASRVRNASWSKRTRTCSLSKAPWRSSDGFTPTSTSRRRSDISRLSSTRSGTLGRGSGAASGEARRRARDPFERPVGGDELGRRLLADAGDAGQVVARVAAQRRVLGVLRGRHAGALEDPGLVVERVVRHARLL